MYKNVIILFMFFILTACGGTHTTPSEPSIIPATSEGVVTMATWQPAQREDGSPGTALGYTVYCALQPGYQSINGIDVGDTTSYPLASLIATDGLWHCSVAPYDADREYERQGESSVRREQAVFSLP